MSAPTSQATPSTMLGRLAVPLSLFLLAIALMLLAETRLSAWAEASEVHHAIQHLLIFLAGSTAGGSGLHINQQRKFLTRN